MIYIALSILASTAIFVVFKLFNKFNINTLQAIIINYITACTLGITTAEGKISLATTVHTNWFFGAVILGFLFISVFNVMALTAQRNGISAASVAGKMSVIIPILFSILFYNESAGFQKITGILLALAAVYLTSVKSDSNIDLKKGLLLPLLLFLGSGIIDTSIKYIETAHLQNTGFQLFLATIFGIAFIIGSCIAIFQIIKGNANFKGKTLVGGIILGIINYLSMYYLIKALQVEGLESSAFFTINNVAIVTLSTLIGLLFFKEKLDLKNWLGIAMAVISIALVTLS